MFVSDKRSSLFGFFVVEEEKKFYKFLTRMARLILENRRGKARGRHMARYLKNTRHPTQKLDKARGNKGWFWLLVLFTYQK
jgi:hypothetical protein